MGWEERGGGRYYYRKRRVGGRVISEYVGPGIVGQLAALLDEESRGERERETRARTQERAEIRAGEVEIREICNRVRDLTSAALLGAGHHTHKGQWRKRRNG